MKNRTFLAAMAICVLEAGVIAFLLLRGPSFSAGPGSYRSLKTKFGDAFILGSAGSPIEVDYVDAGKETAATVVYSDGKRRVRLLSYEVQGRLVVVHQVDMDGMVTITTDSDGDGVPDKRSARRDGKIESFSLDQITWKPEEGRTTQ